MQLHKFTPHFINPLLRLVDLILSVWDCVISHFVSVSYTGSEVQDRQDCVIKASSWTSCGCECTVTQLRPINGTTSSGTWTSFLLMLLVAACHNYCSCRPTCWRSRMIGTRTRMCDQTPACACARSMCSNQHNWIGGSCQRLIRFAVFLWSSEITLMGAESNQAKQHISTHI